MTFALACAFHSGGVRNAHAEAFAVGPNQSGTVESIHFDVVLEFNGHRETVVDQVQLISNAPSAVWLRVFPNHPDAVRRAADALFPNLDQLTTIEEPYNEVLRHNLFGPSVVTLLTRKLSRPHPKPSSPYPEPDRTIEVVRTGFFEGKVESSTITHRPVLPAGLTGLLTEAGVALNASTEVNLAAFLNRGLTIMAVVLRDPHPSSSVPGRIAPLRYEFDTTTPVYPFDLEQGLLLKTLRFYLVSASSLAPRNLETTWDERSWERSSTPPGQFFATYHQPIGGSAIANELAEHADLRAEGAQLVRADFAATRADQRDLEFEHAKHAIMIPGRSRRGSGTDLLLCVLLGITPLIYTPESWFLLWLGTRARARVRASRQAKQLFGVRLWSLYAVIVGGFWAYSLPGGSRVAALIPALIGLVQLAMPYVERDPVPVRVQFQKRK